MCQGWGWGEAVQRVQGALGPAGGACGPCREKGAVAPVGALGPAGGALPLRWGGVL